MLFFLQINNINYMLTVTKCCVGCQGSCQSPRHRRSSRGLEKRVMWILRRKESSSASLLAQEKRCGSRSRGKFVGSFQPVGATGTKTASCLWSGSSRLGMPGADIPSWLLSLWEIQFPTLHLNCKLHSYLPPGVYTMLHIGDTR